MTDGGNSSDKVSNALLRDSFFRMNQPLSINSTRYTRFDSRYWELKEAPQWNEPLGDNFCIIDLDNRPFDKPGQIWSEIEPMDWGVGSGVHGLSIGILNHWLYGKTILPYK